MADKPEDNDDLLRKVLNQVQSALVVSPQEKPATDKPDATDKQILACEDTMEIINSIGKVEGLPQPTRDESVEEARKILRWLRNMEFADQSVEQWLDNSTPKVAVAKKEALQKLLRILAVHIHASKIQGLNPDDPNIENAIDAMKAMGLTMAEHTFNVLLTHEAHLDKLEKMIDEMDERALMRQEQSLSQLLDVMELGMERATGQEVSELSATFRLQTLSEQIGRCAQQLEHSDVLEPPSREESLDLARDIIRKLHNLSFGQQTMQEFIENGKLEDKTAFAQQVAELAGVYRNIIAEAAQSDPNILKDKEVQEANNALSQFAHAVNLMAAKEIPSSIAHAQHIAAEVTQAPEQWADLHDRTVDRLVKSAEGGLEKAIDGMAEQQQEQQQDDDLAQDIIDSALKISDQKKRKKKRRGDSKSKSGKGGKKQRKQHLDLTADDYVLKQGRFAVDAQMARTGSDVPMAGLKPEDMAAIRALGGSLRDIGSQLKDLSTTVSNVSANDKIMPSPNEQSAAQRILDDQPKPTNNRGNSGPGV